MNWIQSLSKAIGYMESHLTENMSMEHIAGHAYTSGSHFQLIFHLVTGITVGEYIRNRRLSLAAQDLLEGNGKIMDVAMRYQYDTQESFSKAFTRFHGVPPSKAREGRITLFHPLSVNVTIEGGFGMSRKLIDNFYWNDLEGEKWKALSSAEQYQKITRWAAKARGQNPGVFDALTEWILDDAQWSEDKLAENEQILMQGVFARFREQNTRLREYLTGLEPTGVVNTAVFKALDHFDRELSGDTDGEENREAVTAMFADFRVMRQRSVREKIAGNKTGPAGTDTVEHFGYINGLKGNDAGVQWALFMPDMVKQQQQGFTVERFEYRTLPAMRFIGQEGEHLESMEERIKLFRALDTLDAASDFDHDLLLMHHYGMGVNTGPWHGFWGRFMKADTPVPQGWVSFDFVPQNDGRAGLPFCSQFAYAAFSGDLRAMHKRAGYDVDAMYDVTRNIMLGQGVPIPYPDKYWTAEVFPKGCDHPSTAYLFSAELESE